MKKLFLLVVVLLLAVIVGYKLFFNKENNPVEKKDQSLAISKNSDAVETSFLQLMNEYYAVKDALVDWDTAKANHAALILQKHTDSLPLKALKADSNVVQTAENFASSISSESKGFIGETSIEQKRRSFNMMTDEVYNLLRTVRFSGAIIYHVKCPMAFNDSEEAYWLSSNNSVVNPYLGKKHPKYNDKMIGCGEVVDSLNFVRK